MNCYATGVGSLRKSCHRIADANPIAVDGFHRESFGRAVAGASRIAGLGQNAAGYHIAGRHQVAAGAHYKTGESLAAGATRMTDSARIGVESHAADAGSAKACCRNALQ
jgi:hypothetical protein